MGRIETLIRRRIPVKEIRVDSEYERLRKLNKKRLPKKRITGRCNPIVEEREVYEEPTPEERELGRMREYRAKKIIPPLSVPDVVRPIIEFPINRKFIEVIKIDKTKEVPSTVEEMRKFNDRNLPKIERPKEEVVVFEKGQIYPPEVEIGLDVKMSFMETVMDVM